jgi:hypothetical protein
MPIATLELTQQQSYLQTSNQNRKITLLKPANIEQPKQNKDIFSSALTSNVIRANTVQLINSQDEIEPVTYERPKELKLQLMILVLERFIGHSLDIGTFSFNPDKDNLNGGEVNGEMPSLNDVFSTASSELINIDGQSFQQNDSVSVELWQSHEQYLDYQVQGQLNINDQALSLDYKLSLSSERSSYSKIEMSAAALKDPLLVQFGSQGLGAIKGQTDFAINQDNALDKLPIFSGDVGYLVYDKNNNQQADDGSELFGPKTGQGFVELAQFDSNKNGFIDAEDQQFEQLYLWQPSDDNNPTEQWLSLKDAKIQAISLSTISTPFDFYDQQGEVQAQLRQSSFAISDSGLGRGVHQVDVRI